MDSSEMSLHKKLQECQSRRAEAETVVLYLARLSVENAQKVQSQEDSSWRIQVLEQQSQRAQEEISLLKTELGNVMSILARTLQTQPTAPSPKFYSPYTKPPDAGGSTKTQDCLDLIDLSDTSEPLSGYGSSGEQTLVNGSEDRGSAHDQRPSPPPNIQESGLPPTQHVFRFQNVPTRDNTTSWIQGADTGDIILRARETSTIVPSFPVQYRPLLSPNWATGPDVFNDEPEKKTCLLAHQRLSNPGTDLNFPDFFRYGIRFVPLANDTDRFRTVMISQLPPGITLASILGQVRGGLVVDATILETYAITKSMSARIVFAREAAAKSFVKHADNNPLSFEGKMAKTTLVNTPTWPINLRLRKAIVDYQHTRCLEIGNFPGNVSCQGLLNELDVITGGMLDRMLVRHGRTSKGSISLDFSSVRFAGYIYGRLSMRRAYRSCMFNFTPDLCARPWDQAYKGKGCPSTLQVLPNLPEKEEEDNASNNFEPFNPFESLCKDPTPVPINEDSLGDKAGPRDLGEAEIESDFVKKPSNFLACGKKKFCIEAKENHTVGEIDMVEDSNEDELYVQELLESLKPPSLKPLNGFLVDIDIPGVSG